MGVGTVLGSVTRTVAAMGRGVLSGRIKRKMSTDKTGSGQVNVWKGGCLRLSKVKMNGRVWQERRPNSWGGIAPHKARGGLFTEELRVHCWERKPRMFYEKSGGGRVR